MTGLAPTLGRERPLGRTGQPPFNRRRVHGTPMSPGYVQNRPRFGQVLKTCPHDGHVAWSSRSPQRIAPAAQLASPPGRGAEGEGVAVYRDMPGFCKAAKLEEIRKHGYVLTPGRYVGAEAAEQDD